MKQRDIQHDLNGAAQVIISNVVLFKEHHKMATEKEENRKVECQQAIDCITLIRTGIDKYLNTISHEFVLEHGVMGNNDIKLK